jgi:hypothetical protein
MSRSMLLSLYVFKHKNVSWFVKGILLIFQGAGGVGKVVADWMVHGHAPGNMLHFEVTLFRKNLLLRQKRIFIILGSKIHQSS